MADCKPLFIAVEGLDGSGKGTQLGLLASRLESMGVKVCLTSEPTQFTTGGIIRDALSGLTKRTPAELAGLFLADRIAHCTTPDLGIKSILERGVTVITDRYYYSSFAYQGIDTDLEWVMSSNLDCPDILKPDLCIFLDVPTDVCDERISSGRVSREIYENRDAIERTRKKYFEVFKILGDHNIRVISAVGEPNEVAERVFEAVSEAMKQA